MQAAYDNETVFNPDRGLAVWMAPVGHTFAHSSQAVQREKSMVGNPNDGCTSNGLASVRIPVFRLVEIILSICV